MRRLQNTHAADFEFKLNADHLMIQSLNVLDFTFIYQRTHFDRNDSMGKMAAGIKLRLIALIVSEGMGCMLNLRLTPCGIKIKLR